MHSVRRGSVRGRRRFEAGCQKTTTTNILKQLCCEMKSRSTQRPGCNCNKTQTRNYCHCGTKTIWHWCSWNQCLEADLMLMSSSSVVSCSTSTSRSRWCPKTSKDQRKNKIIHNKLIFQCLQCLFHHIFPFFWTFWNYLLIISSLSTDVVLWARKSTWDESWTM